MSSGDSSSDQLQQIATAVAAAMHTPSQEQTVLSNADKVALHAAAEKMRQEANQLDRGLPPSGGMVP